MPMRPFVERPEEGQAQRRAARRRARYGDLLARHLVWLGATGRTPTASAAVLFCSRSSVDRPGRAAPEGTLDLKPDAQGRLMAPVRTTVRLPMRRRALLARLQASPRASGWGRTRGSCATLALPLQPTRGITVAAETMRRGRHESGWGCKRAKLVAKDDDPPRVDRWAGLRWACEPLPLEEAMGFAAERALHLVPKVGWAGMPQGTQVAGMMPGPHQQHSWAEGLELATGTRPHGLGARTTHALVRALLSGLEERDPPERDPRRSVGGDPDTSQKAQAVEPWLAAHPRGPRLWLPTYCPRATPLERACGDVHDGCTRTHQRKCLPELLADVEDHLPLNGPGQYQWAALSYTPAVTAAIEKIAAQPQAKVAA